MAFTAWVLRVEVDRGARRRDEVADDDVRDDDWHFALLGCLAECSFRAALGVQSIATQRNARVQVVQNAEVVERLRLRLSLPMTAQYLHRVTASCAAGCGGNSRCLKELRGNAIASAFAHNSVLELSQELPASGVRH